MAVLPPPCQSAVVRPDRPSELWFIQASVVFLFLLPGLNARLRPTLAAQLRPGARVLSAEFQVLAMHLAGKYTHANYIPIPTVVLSAEFEVHAIHGCSDGCAASYYSLTYY